MGKGYVVSLPVDDDDSCTSNDFVQYAPKMPLRNPETRRSAITDELLKNLENNVGESHKSSQPVPHCIVLLNEPQIAPHDVPCRRKHRKRPDEQMKYDDFETMLSLLSPFGGASVSSWDAMTVFLTFGIFLMVSGLGCVFVYTMRNRRRSPMAERIQRLRTELLYSQ